MKWYEIFDYNNYNDPGRGAIWSILNFIMGISFWGVILFIVIMALIYFWYVLIPLGIVLWLIDYKKK